MDFSWTEEQTALRERVRDLLARELPPDWARLSRHGPGSPEQTAFSLNFCPKLAEAGLLVPHWPVEHGGRGAPPWHHFIIGEERFAREGLALAATAGQLARTAADAAPQPVKVAGSLPPLFGSYRPDLFQPERVADLLTPLLQGLAPHVDLWLAETQSSIVEARAIHAGLPKDGKPFWLSFTLKDEDTDEVPRLRSGEPVAEAAAVAAELGVETLLFNCSQPEVIGAAIDAARDTFERLGVKINIGAYANAFPPQPKEATANDGLDPLREDLDPPGYLHWAIDWQQRGASHLGGCCGIGPEHIAVLAQKLG